MQPEPEDTANESPAAVAARVWVVQTSNEMISALRQTHQAEANRAGKDMIGKRIQNWTSAIADCDQALVGVVQLAQNTGVAMQALVTKLREMVAYHQERGRSNWGIAGRDSVMFGALQSDS
jgi:hypothetical protein